LKAAETAAVTAEADISAESLELVSLNVSAMISNQKHTMSTKRISPA
jgi:hypothetical protein